MPAPWQHNWIRQFLYNFSNHVQEVHEQRGIFYATIGVQSEPGKRDPAKIKTFCRPFLIHFSIVIVGVQYTIKAMYCGKNVRLHISTVGPYKIYGLERKTLEVIVVPTACKIGLELCPRYAT